MIINKTKPNTSTWQYAFISVVVEGTACKLVVSTPVLSETELQTYCNEREDEYKIMVLKAMYPDARYQDSLGKTDLEKFEKWIADGRINEAYQDEEGKEIPETVVERVSWVDMYTPDRLEILEAKVAVLEDKTAALEAGSAELT